MGSGAAEPGAGFVLPGGQTHGVFGDVQAVQGSVWQRGSHLGAVVSLAAAGVQDGPGFGTIALCGLTDRLRQRGVEACLQKGPTRCHLLPGVARMEGALLGHRQQIDIALPGNIKAVPLGAGPLPGAQGECSPAGGAENIRHKNASLRHNNVVPSSYPTKGNPSRRTGRRSFG